jgi:hypothetical protein
MNRTSLSSQQNLYGAQPTMSDQLETVPDITYQYESFPPFICKKSFPRRAISRVCCFLKNTLKSSTPSKPLSRNEVLLEFHRAWIYPPPGSDNTRHEYRFTNSNTDIPTAINPLPPATRRFHKVKKLASIFTFSRGSRRVFPKAAEVHSTTPRQWWKNKVSFLT